MEHVTGELGKTLLDILAIGLLIVYLLSTIRDDAGNQGILNIMGAGIQNTSADYNSYSDFKVYEAEAVKEAPVISVTATGAISTGAHRIADYIKATDHNGDDITVKVISIRAPDNVVIADSATTAMTEVNFLSPGIYTAEVYAVDGAGRKTTCRIRIPVNSQGVT